MAEWLPIESAPSSGLILIAVESKDGIERRTFAAEASYGDSGHHWSVTHGWLGFTKLHQGWMPIAWMPLPSPPSRTDDARKALGGGDGRG